MSAALLGLALKAKLHSQTRKMVLIKLVDCCHEDGTRIYPSLATIAEDAECSVPTARRVMQVFCRVGLLRKVREGGSGAKSTNHYEMDIDLLARLRRPELWPALEAAAQHDPSAESDEDEDAAPPAKAAEPAQNKGITVEGYHRDTLPNRAEGYHPDDTQPLSYNPYSEREGVRARADRPASEGAPADAGGQAPGFDEFLEAYPFAKGDNRAQLRAAWETLPFGERRAAIDGIGAYAAERKAAGLKSRLSGPQYLLGRNWVGLDAKAAQRKATQAATAIVEIKGWSRDWWLILLWRLAEGLRQKASFAVQQAEAGKSISATTADLAAAGRRIGELKPFLCNGPEIDAWRPWLAERGGRIPVLDGTFRVFLPSEVPPGGRVDEGDRDVRF